MSVKSIKDIVERIRALRAKAADDGATEAEAMQAAALAAKLLNKHNIAEADLRDPKEQMSADTVGAEHHSSRLPDVARFVFSEIERLTETKAYNQSGQMRFIGVGADPEMAVYLYELIVGACEREWKRYWTAAKKEPEHARRASRAYTNYVKRGFVAGFGRRVSDRLAKMVQEKRDAYAAEVKDKAAGTALVIKKKDLVRQKELSLKLTKGRAARRRNGSPAARTAGELAGGEVNLGRPLGGSGSSAGMLH